MKTKTKSKIKLKLRTLVDRIVSTRIEEVRYNKESKHRDKFTYDSIFDCEVYKEKGIMPRMERVEYN